MSETLKSMIDCSNLNGLYRGIVVSISDPKHRGRVQVRVPFLYGTESSDDGFVSDTDLPWAVPAVSFRSSVDAGSLVLPSVGSVVYVLFEDGSSVRPVYFGTIPLVKNGHIIDGYAKGTIATQDWIYAGDSSVKYDVLYKSVSGNVVVTNRDTDGIFIGVMKDDKYYNGFYVDNKSIGFYLKGAYFTIS